MTETNKLTKTIKITAQRVTLTDLTLVRRLENAGWTVTIVITGR